MGAQAPYNHYLRLKVFKGQIKTTGVTEEIFRRTGSRVRSRRIMEVVKSMEQIFEKIIAFIKMLLSMIGMI